MTPAPVLRIDLASPTPVYRQVAASLRTVLVAGELGEGDQLPTIRELAVDLGVHRNTIAEAYRVLAAEGWIELRRRHGARVVARPTPVADAAGAAVFERRLRELAAEALASGLTRPSVGASLRAAAREIEDDADGRDE